MGRAGGDLPQDSPAPSWLVQDKLKPGGDLGAEFPGTVWPTSVGCRNTSLRPCSGEPPPSPFGGRSTPGCSAVGWVSPGQATPPTALTPTPPRLGPPGSRRQIRGHTLPGRLGLQPWLYAEGSSKQQEGPRALPGAAGDTAGWQGHSWVARRKAGLLRHHQIHGCGLPVSPARRDCRPRCRCSETAPRGSPGGAAPGSW